MKKKEKSCCAKDIYICCEVSLTQLLLTHIVAVTTEAVAGFISRKERERKTLDLVTLARFYAASKAEKLFFLFALLDAKRVIRRAMCENKINIFTLGKRREVVCAPAFGVVVRLTQRPNLHEWGLLVILAALCFRSAER